MEAQLGLTLLDRSGYRMALTAAGRSFHDRARVFLQELRGLQNHARQLAMGEESEFSVVIGDLSPVPEVLALFGAFFDRHPATRLHLHVEAIAGPWERLFDGAADLIIHHIDKADPRLEFVNLFTVALIPVVAPAAATSLLINNAGVLDFAGPLETDDEIIDRNMAVNFNGTMAMTRAFAPVIARNGGGDVVNILTFLSFVSAPVFAAYGASKAASWAMAMSLRPVLAPDGVRVVNVFPTTIDTEMVAGLDKPKDTARDVAGELVSGIIEGREDIYPCKASATFAAWRTDQKAVERQFAKLVSR